MTAIDVRACTRVSNHGSRHDANTHGRPAHFVAWLVGERVVRGTVTVVALAAVARHLAPAGFGVLNFALAIVGLATPLAQLGLDSMLVRDLVRFPDRTGALLGTSFVLRLVPARRSRRRSWRRPISRACSAPPYRPSPR